MSLNQGAARLDLSEGWPERWLVSWKAGRDLQSKSVDDEWVLDEAEALLDMDGRRERLEEVVAGLRSGETRAVDHVTARDRIEKRIRDQFGRDEPVGPTREQALRPASVRLPVGRVGCEPPLPIWVVCGFAVAGWAAWKQQGRKYG